MTLSKDQLRKIHGILEPSSPPEQAVISQRKYHEAAAVWLAKRAYLLQAVFASIGFVVVLLPVLSKSWRAAIESIPILRGVFYAYSTFSGLAMTNLIVLMFLFLLRSWQIKSLPGGASAILTYQDVVDMELYPRSRREDFAYWTDILFGFLGTTLWLFIPFGVLAYFIKIGG